MKNSKTLFKACLVMACFFSYHIACAQSFWNVPQTAADPNIDILREGGVAIGNQNYYLGMGKFEINNNDNSMWCSNMMNGAGGGRVMRLKGGFPNGSQSIFQVEANSWSNMMLEDNIRFNVLANGNVGIGVQSPAYKLDVCGDIRAKRVKVETNWCDYVFASDYKLINLYEVEKYINANKHLPEIPSEKEIVANGLDIGAMQALHMKKIEELTLYIINLQKQIDELKKSSK